jgi:hypothetical protein
MVLPLIHPIGLNGILSGVREVAFHVPFKAESHCKHITVECLVANPPTCLTHPIKKELALMLTRVWSMTLRGKSGGRATGTIPRKIMPSQVTNAMANGISIWLPTTLQVICSRSGRRVSLDGPQKVLSGGVNTGNVTQMHN